MTEAILSKLSQLSFVLGGAGMVGYQCLYTVDGGERAVMFNRFGGVSNKIIGEGTHFKIPWFQIPYIYDVRIKPKNLQTTTGTKDLQTISISLRLLFRPKMESLPTIHQTLGPDYDERVIPSIGNEILKSVVAQFTAEQLLTFRDDVSKDIFHELKQRASKFNLIMDDVSVTHLQYGKEFARAIEEKQVAEQEAERKKFMVAISEEERQAVIVKAEGEAIAAEMISKALKEHGTGLIDLRRIDAAKEIAETLAKGRNVSYVPATGSNLLLNVTA
eukprot:GHVL01008909.1.p1 GENE.GHVL01008909.1~~GHVL01008909.1.p1  ORF type:complete len:274 (+),score=44.55 GHVL01008909.1:578-1399(+)